VTAGPETLEEWQAHVSALSGEALVAEGASANSIRFVMVLEEEGYEPADIHAILRMFARRFREVQLRPPQDGLYDFDAMAR
jgi:hypothetical protein